MIKIIKFDYFFKKLRNYFTPRKVWCIIDLFNIKFACNAGKGVR